MQNEDDHFVTIKVKPAPGPAAFRALVDGMAQLAWLADGDGSIHWFNRRWYDQTGTTPEQMRDGGWKGVLHPDHVGRVTAALARAFTTGTSWQDTIPLRGRDGKFRWFLSRAEPVWEATGRPSGWIGTHTDITEQRAAQAGAEADAERVRLALSAGAIVGTWFWDVRRDRLTFDEASARAFGMEGAERRRDLSLEQVMASVHPLDRDELKAAIAEAMGRGGTYAHEFRVRRAGGRYRWIAAHGRVDLAPDGTPVAFPGVLIDIEESRATAAALRDTSRRLNAILDNTQAAVFLMDDRQHCVYANAAAERLTGYAQAEFRGRPLHDVVHHKKPDGSHYPIEECPIERAFPSRARMQGEELFVAPDGSFYPVAFTASPITDEAERPIGTVIEARNIAEEKAREAALREAEARQRSILDAIPQMVWTARADGHHDFYNARWYEFTGVPDGSTDGEGWSGMFHPEDQERAWSRWRHSLASGEPYEIEYRLRHRDGDYRWVLGRALPVRTSDGIIDRWMGTCTEIDDLRRTADELLRTSALLRLISDSTPDLIYAKDIEGRVLYTNLAVQRVVGQPLEEIVGQTDLDFAADPAQASAIMENERRVIESGETLEIDETYTGADGRTRQYRSLKAPLRTADDHVIGIVGVSSDMTKRREAEGRERLLAQEVDHRAKNMLAVVQSLVNLTRHEDPAAFRKAIIGRIQALARSHNLLSASRWHGVDLQELVRQELAAFAGRDQLARVAGPALALPPDCAQSIGLILHELTTNAAKYGAFSRPEGRLELDWDLWEGKRTELRLSWRESGGPAVVPPNRSGFGTALIETSVGKLGGQLSMNWWTDGLACEISIPYNPSDEAGDREAEAAHPDGDAAATGGGITGKRVLLVEDEVLIAMDIKAMLVAAGAEVLGPAVSVEAGLRLIADTAPDVALLDVNLGGREFSYPLADALVARQIPFAFCTGYASAADFPLRFAKTTILGKPIDQKAVTDTLGRLAEAGRETTDRGRANFGSGPRHLHHRE